MQHLRCFNRLDGFPRLIGQLQAELSAEHGVPGDLQQAQQGQDQTDWQYDEGNPARDRQILGFDANGVELGDI